MVTSDHLSLITSAVNSVLVDFCSDWGLALYQTSIAATYTPTDTTDSSPIIFLLDDKRSGYPLYIDYANFPGAAGFHNVTGAAATGNGDKIGGISAQNNLPYAIVLCQRFNGVVNNSPKNKTVSVGISHEIFELLANPYLKNLVKGEPIQVGDRQIKRFYHFEVSDAVSGASNIVLKNTVFLADYILPSWANKYSSGPWSYSGKPGVTLVKGSPLRGPFDVGVNSSAGGFDVIEAHPFETTYNNQDLPTVLPNCTYSK
jgi:hypothetical protein